MPSSGHLELQVVASHELARHRSTWTELARSANVSPFAFSGFFDAWCTSFGAERTGFVVLGLAGQSLELVLPFWHSNAQPTEWNTLGAFRADYSEAITRSENPKVVSELWHWLTLRAPCQSARLARIPEDSLLGRGIPHSAFNRRGRMLTAASSLLVARKARYLTTHLHDEHPYADRAQIEAMADRLERNATRRNLKMLEKHGSVAYDVVFGTGELLALLPTLFEMHVTNFAGTGRVSQFARAEERTFFEALVISPDLHGVIYMDVLRVGGRPVAMHLGFQHQRRIYYSKPAFDLELGKASPGKSLLAHLFARAKRDNIERVDLLKGAESYKAEWANHSRRTITTQLVQRDVRDLVRAMVRRS